MSRKAADPALRTSGAGASRRDDGFRLGLLLGALGPPLVMGAGAAVLFASIRPPLAWITGFTRWQVQPPFAAAGIMLSLWLCAVPFVAGLYVCFMRAGPRRLRGCSPAAAAAAALLAAAALTLVNAWATTGGPGRPAFGDALAKWAAIWGAACAGIGLCLDLGVRIGRWRARRSGRG